MTISRNADQPFCHCVQCRDLVDRMAETGMLAEEIQERPSLLAERMTEMEHLLTPKPSAYYKGKVEKATLIIR